MQKTSTISNAHVQVYYQSRPEMIVVCDLRNANKQQPFSGFDGLKDLFETYCASFNEQIGYNESCDFFKPNIQSLVINAPAK
jgi:hypothetical protein